jgi:hypothetical protein
MGYETSFLGYPTSDEHNSSAGRRNDFQNGGIHFTPSGGAEVQPQAFTVSTPITFPAGIALGGSGKLTLFSDGTTHFEGHLHDSGFPSYDSLAIFTVTADGRAYTASKTGHTEGTDVVSQPRRDLIWDDWGTDDAVRQNWAKIRSSGVGHSHVEVTSDWSAQKIAEDVVAVAGLVLSIIPLIFSGGSSKKSADPNYRLPDASEDPTRTVFPRFWAGAHTHSARLITLIAPLAENQISTARAGRRQTQDHGQGP